MQQHVFPRRWILALCGAVVLGSLIALPVAPVAAATTYTVNVTTDTGAGAGTTGDLRYAVNQVNAGSGGDTINITATGTITLTSALPALAKDVTITGPGTTSLTVSGSNAYTIFTVGTGVTASISNLTIANGFSDPNGAIRNDGTLTVYNATFSGNVAGSFGSGFGGAIYSTGTLTVISSSFTNNRSGGADLGGGGGAIYSTGMLAVTGSEFDGNSTSGNQLHSFARGGAIATTNTATITNSTFTGNGARNEGGAIDNTGGANIAFDTITGNSAVSAGGIATTGSLNLLASIVTGNNGFTTSGPFPDDISGSFSGTNNLISTPASLGPLADNGGPTRTMALNPDSPAIDAGGLFCPATDQRGVTRPQGLACDIGAFEWPIVTSRPASRPSAPAGSPAPSPLPVPRSPGALPAPSPRPVPAGGSTASPGGPTPNPLPVSRL